MFKNPNHIPAFIFIVTLVLISNPELLTLILTVQAIGVETFILLLTLQSRSIVIGVKDLFAFLLIPLKLILMRLNQTARSFLFFMLYLTLNPRQLIVVRQLALLMHLRTENTFQLLFPRCAHIF